MDTITVDHRRISVPEEFWELRIEVLEGLPARKRALLKDAGILFVRDLDRLSPRKLKRRMGLSPGSRRLEKSLENLGDLRWSQAEGVVDPSGRRLSVPIRARHRASDDVTALPARVRAAMRTEGFALLGDLHAVMPDVITEWAGCGPAAAREVDRILRALAADPPAEGLSPEGIHVPGALHDLGVEALEGLPDSIREILRKAGVRGLIDLDGVRPSEMALGDGCDAVCQSRILTSVARLVECGTTAAGDPVDPSRGRSDRQALMDEAPVPLSVVAHPWPPPERPSPTGEGTPLLIPDHLHDVMIEELSGLPIRVLRVIRRRRERYSSLGDLHGLGSEEILGWENFGPVGLRMLQEEVKAVIRGDGSLMTFPADAGPLDPLRGFPAFARMIAKGRSLEDDYEVVRRLHGLDGRPAESLGRVARALGVSPGRARSRAERLEEELKAAFPARPGAYGLPEAVSSQWMTLDRWAVDLPWLVAGSRVESELRESYRVHEEVEVPALPLIMKLLGRYREISGGGLGLDPDEARYWCASRRTVREISRMVSGLRAVLVASRNGRSARQLLEILKAKYRLTVSEESIETVLALMPDVEPLGSGARWRV